MNSNNIESTQKRPESESNSKKEPSLQFGLSISIGVLTIILIATSFYLGLFH